MTIICLAFPCKMVGKKNLERGRCQQLCSWPLYGTYLNNNLIFIHYNHFSLNCEQNYALIYRLEKKLLIEF